MAVVGAEEAAETAVAEESREAAPEPVDEPSADEQAADGRDYVPMSEWLGDFDPTR